MRPLACSLAAVLAIVFAINAPAQNAQVTDLGANLVPFAINRAGTVVGVARTQTAFGFTPFVWQNGVLTLVQQNGWAGGYLRAINGAGVAVGQAAVTTTAGEPFVYRNGVATLLGLGGGFASAINDNGVIGGDVVAGPFVDVNGTLTVLAQVGDVNAIDSAGDAAGDAIDSSSNWTAAVWIAPSYTLQLLPGLGGTQSDALAMNDHGTIVGGAIPPSSVNYHAVIWQNGAVTDIGVPAGAYQSLAEGVNNSGTVVGDFFSTSGTTAFVYRNGTITTLNDVAGAATGWQFLRAKAINDSGTIVGVGIAPNTTEQHAFALQLQQTPAQIIASTIATINGFGLNGGIAQSLDAKLQAIAAEVGQPTACSDLAAFVNEVKAQQGKHLTVAQANVLLADAAALATAMGC